MFAERFDALMCIAEINNSLLGRAVNMNSSHIGRLRNGVRPLPQKHDYLTAICQYLAAHISQDYQLVALQKLTDIPAASLSSKESMAHFLEHWLTSSDQNFSAAGRLISGFSSLSSASPLTSTSTLAPGPSNYAGYLYGNAGKRKAVEQFFFLLLQEKKPQTLLLFSDENMAWLYENPAFTKRWIDLFTQVILNGNRVKIIHTLSRDLNDLMEAVLNWLPIYMTGAIEPFYYPRIKDGIFQHTLFIAPHIAAILSSSVKQQTEGMLNFFITDHTAISALKSEFDQYFALCRPLMRIYTHSNLTDYHQAMDALNAETGDVLISSHILPLFAMPKSLVTELSRQTANDTLLSIWQKNVATFQQHIKKQHLSLQISQPEQMLLPSANAYPFAALYGLKNFIYTQEHYLIHYTHLMSLEKQYANLTITTNSLLSSNMLLYAKEDTAIVLIKTSSPLTVFMIKEPTMINAIWNYMKIAHNS